jgi:hypothetical protein
VAGDGHADRLAFCVSDDLHIVAAAFAGKSLVGHQEMKDNEVLKAKDPGVNM